MKIFLILAALAFTSGLAGQVLAQTGEHNAHAMNSPYSGQDSRQVTTLSADDINQLLAGKGWELAKPAEFNGYPGPVHVLELSRQLKLSPDQRKRIEGVFREMQTSARKLGAQYIAEEAALDMLFRSANPDKAAIAIQLATTGKLYGSLRLTHLSAHIEIKPVLTLEQRQLYARLRGYGIHQKN